MRCARRLKHGTGRSSPGLARKRYASAEGLKRGACIGPNTVNTAPAETLPACRDRGKPKFRLEEYVKEARWVLARLPELGLSIENATWQLENEGIEKLEKPFEKLMETLVQKSPRHLARESCK
jgi:transaldolase